MQFSRAAVMAFIPVMTLICVARVFIPAISRAGIASSTVYGDLNRHRCKILNSFSYIQPTVLRVNRWQCELLQNAPRFCKSKEDMMTRVVVELSSIWITSCTPDTVHRPTSAFAQQSPPWSLRDSDNITVTDLRLAKKVRVPCAGIHIRSAFKARRFGGQRHARLRNQSRHNDFR